MRAKRKTAPEQSAAEALSGARSGARWRGPDIQPASRTGYRTRGRNRSSSRRLRCWTEDVGTDHVARDASNALQVKHAFSWHSAP